MKSLQDIHHWLIDMDGVLYHGNQRMPGAAEFIAALQGGKVSFLLVTNNSTLTPEEYVAKVAGMGIEVKPGDVLTSSIATAEYLSRIAPPGAPVQMIGEDGLRTALLDKGFELVDRGGDYVVVGMNRQLTFDMLGRANLAIRAGAKFIGTNPDLTLPVEEGQILGNGAILVALEAASGVKPFIIGKPQISLLQIGMERLGVTKQNTAILGDRVETDILGGQNADLITVMVLSGVSTREDLNHLGLHPDFVFENVSKLVEAWQERDRAN
jgi:4-nitrophenyl phosphatase